MKISLQLELGFMVRLAAERIKIRRMVRKETYVLIRQIMERDVTVEVR